MEFSKEWWKGFLSSTENMTKPISVDNVFSDGTSDNMLKNTLGVFRNLDKNAIFRIYVDGKQRDDLNSVLINNPPLKNDSVKSWTDRIFGMQKFGIIFNHGECWNKEFALDIYQKLEPLFEELGHPIMGVDVTFFIGNYGWTPLGVHVDYIGESVLHMHLGPGEKDMYLWDKKVYSKELNGKSGEKRAELFTHRATKYEIKKGGVFFMPWGNPHIGKSDELSVSATAWLRKPTKNRMRHKLLDNIIAEYLIDEGNDFDSEQDRFEKDSLNTAKFFEYQKDVLIDIYEELIEDSPKKNKLDKLSISDLLKMSAKDFQYSLKSNLNFTNSLVSSKEKETFLISKETLISLDHPYKIEWYNSKISNKLHLFMKGKKTMFVYNKDIIEIINRLNRDEEHTLGNLTDGLFLD